MNNDDSYAEFIVLRDRLTEPLPSVDPADALGEQSLMGSSVPKDTNVLPTDKSGVEDYKMDALGQNSLTGREVDLPFAPEMPQQTDVGLASTIGTNLKALPGAVARGGAAAIYETMFSAGQLTETQVQQMRDMDKKLTEGAVQRGANEMVVSGAQGLAQFGVGMFPAFKALRLAGLGRPAAALISEGLAGAFAFNPDDPNIGNFVQSLKPESPVIQNMANFIATDPNDTVAENRFRNALQDTIPSGIIESVIKVVKGVRGLDAETLIKKGEEAEARLNNLGNTLSANPVGPVADMAVAGVGKVAGAMQPQKPAPVFYSAVANAVDALPMEKGGGDQMRAMIAKSAEVKPEEMAWIGLDDFLKGKKSVTKQEIKKFVDANQVQIEEVTLPRKKDIGIKSSEEYRAELENMSDRDLADRTAEEYGLDSDEMYIDIVGKDPASVSERDQYIDDLVDTFEQTLGNRGLDNAGMFAEPAKFATHTLPGGKNYREVLLRLPEKQAPQVEKYTVQENENGLFDIVNSRGELVEVEATREAAEDAARQFGEGSSIAVPGGSAVNFTGGHFDESNVLAHVRLNDRTGPNGEKILFVEEFQSDWHQRGQKRGYQTPEQKAKLGALKAQRKKILEQRGAKSEIQTWRPRLEELTDKRIAESLDGLTEAEQKEYINLIKKREAFDEETATALKATDSQITSMITNIPDAPLKKTWQEMSFRRVARMAAEEGYDAIAWTPGKLQAERYDLSKQISEVHLSGSNFKAYDLNGEEVISRTGVRTEDLPELIGKETADRLMSQKPKNGLRSLTGQDLHVGGKFHKVLYDKKIKQYADKWGKKFGAKVGVTDLKGAAKNIENDDIHVISEVGNTWVGKLEDGGTITVSMDDFPDVADASEEMIRIKSSQNDAIGTQVWTMPVTKKMKDSVLSKGVATFGASGLAIGMNKEAQNGN